jgi:hypothetical protein
MHDNVHGLVFNWNIRNQTSDLKNLHLKMFLYDICLSYSAECIASHTFLYRKQSA